MHCYPLGSEPRGTQISPIGAIPKKKNQPGKWRLITDLSFPAGTSVNDAISKELSSLKYTSVDHLSSLILSEGKGAFLVKADIKAAYRMVPVHRDDQSLLEYYGMVEYILTRCYYLVCTLHPSFSQQ